jgi:hypothetical protein
MLRFCTFKFDKEKGVEAPRRCCIEILVDFMLVPQLCMSHPMSLGARRCLDFEMWSAACHGSLYLRCAFSTTLHALRQFSLYALKAFQSP